MKKLKILITNSFYPPFHVGGACVHSKYLAEELVKRGHEVHVLTSLDAYNLKRKEERLLENDNGVLVHRIKSPIGILEPILNYFIGTQRYTYNYFRNLIEKENFDVVHHHNPSLLGYKIIKKIGHYKNLYTAHDYWLLYPFLSKKSDIFRINKKCSKKDRCETCFLLNKHPYPIFWNYSSYKGAVNDIDTIISPSLYISRYYKKYLKNKIKVINNFVPDMGKINHQYIYRDYFIFVGQLEEYKGILQLIDVFKSINKNLLIVGTGSLERDIKKRIKNYKNIKLLGWKPHNELFPLVKNAEALVLPSLWAENMPLVILEAYSLGTPAIGSNLGGIPELINKIDKNLIFNHKNFNDLTNIIKNFNKNKYKKDVIISVYRKFFSTEKYIKDYNKILNTKNE